MKIIKISSLKTASLTTETASLTTEASIPMYEAAKELMKEHVKEDWVPRAAWNDAITSYPLSLDEQQKLWVLAKRLWGVD